jgi:uncharacterized protein (DUF433 family)
MAGHPLLERIVCDPKIHHSEPAVKGTRIAVATIVASLADMTVEELLREFPPLAREDVQAALHDAADATHRSLVA